MSCRQSHSRTSQISLLPQFSVPPGVTDFATENRPPHLPPRNSPSRLFVMAVATVLCIVGSYSTVSAAATPMLKHSTDLVSGVTSAVGKAISHANAQAELQAKKHYDARHEYMSRRRLSIQKTPHAAHPHAQPPQPTETGTVARASEATPGVRPKSALLLRMAALRKQDTPVSTIDEDAVEQFFPGWIRHRNQKQWDEDAVLKDLVLAVSQLAHAVSVDGTPADEELPQYNSDSGPSLEAPPT